MPTYSFKKECRVYVVYGGEKFNIDISDIDFSQTIAFSDYKVNTLHNPGDLFAGVSIQKVNPANFSLNFPAIKEPDFLVLFYRALDYKTFDLYIETLQDVFKIESCVITNTNFIINKQQPLRIAIQGEGTKLTREGDYGSSIPGTEEARSQNRSYNLAKYLQIALDSVNLDNIVSVNVELQNVIKWTPYKTIENACTDSISLAYPSEFSLDKRILAGNVRTNAIEDTNYSMSVPLLIKAGEVIGTNFYGFEFNMSEVSFTNRINTGQIFSTSYDWRLTQDIENLGEVLEYRTLVQGALEPIYDDLDQPIQDEGDEPIYENL